MGNQSIFVTINFAISSKLIDPNKKNLDPNSPPPLSPPKIKNRILNSVPIATIYPQIGCCSFSLCSRIVYISFLEHTQRDSDSGSGCNKFQIRQNTSRSGTFCFLSLFNRRGIFYKFLKESLLAVTVIKVVFWFCILFGSIQDFLKDYGWKFASKSCRWKVNLQRTCSLLSYVNKLVISW